MSEARYQLQAKVHTGPLGAVHRAWDTVAGCCVALREKRAATLEAAALRELHTVAGVPALVAEDEARLAVRWVQGLNLDELCRQGPEGRAQALRCVPELLRTLSQVHERGWLHGDVTASNVMRGEQDGETWLIDWSCAQRWAEPRAGDAPGTIFYMAPELFDQQPLSVAAELYAVGVLFYECVAGELPFQGESRLQVITSHHRHDCVPLRDAGQRAWFEQLTARQPEMRCPSAQYALAAWHTGWGVQS
jgi:eukaryotic-like serine/threonine-protein kinase